MKFEKFKHSMLPAGFAFGLFASSQNFILMAPDNSVAGQGVFEETSDDVVQSKITVQGKEFTGTGTITVVRPKKTPGVRSDRAFLGSFGKIQRKQSYFLVTAKDGAKLACEFSIFGSEVEGKCIDPDTQQMLTVKTPPSEPS